MGLIKLVATDCGRPTTMIVAADDHGAAVLGEFGEHGVGVGGVALVNHDDADVFHGDDTAGGEVGGKGWEGPGWLGAAENVQLLVFGGEVARVAGDFDGAFDRWLMSYFAD